MLAIFITLAPDIPEATFRLALIRQAPDVLARVRSERHYRLELLRIDLPGRDGLTTGLAELPPKLTLRGPTGRGPSVRPGVVEELVDTLTGPTG